jgi:hypothetical protein
VFVELAPHDDDGDDVRPHTGEIAVTTKAASAKGER